MHRNLAVSSGGGRIICLWFTDFFSFVWDRGVAAPGIVALGISRRDMTVVTPLRRCVKVGVEFGIAFDATTTAYVGLHRH